MRMMRLAATLLAMAATASSGGGAATQTSSLPLLTFSVTATVHRGVSLTRGLCATDLQGHVFRISDPLFDGGEAWSPDGGSIAFLRSQSVSAALMVTDAQGRDPRQIGGGGYGWLEFDWSPDGNELAVSSNLARFGEGSIGIVKADGTGGRVLFTAGYGAYASRPAWSPDGSRILFSFSQSGDNSGPATYVINVDGTNRRQLLASTAEAVWSPDGTQFAYIAYVNFAYVGLGVAQADGSKPTS